jgi:hypothetical protein
MIFASTGDVNMENLIFGAVMLVTIVGPPAPTDHEGLAQNIAQTGYPGRRDIVDHPPPPPATRIRQLDKADPTTPKKTAR